MAFTPPVETNIDVCFENILGEGITTRDVSNVGRSSGAFRTVELDVDIGSAGFDYYALQKSEVHTIQSRSNLAEFETD